MSFKTNDCQQLLLNDSFMTLTERERKALENSGRRYSQMRFFQQ